MSSTEVSVPDEMSEVDQMLSALGEIRLGGDTEGGEETSTDEEEAAPEEVTPSPSEEPEEVGDAAAPPAAELTPPGYIDFEGQQLPVSDVRAFLELNERLRNDPEAAQRVTKALRPPEEAPELPEWLDPEDTQSVQMFRHLQRVEQSANAMAAQARATAEREQRERVVDGFRTGVAQFRTRYPNLTDDQVSQVAQAASRAGIIDGLERSEGSISAAFDKGMDMVLWSDPALRSLATADVGSSVSPKSDRKAKQSALSGSGGSTPQTKRSPEKPKTREELMARMLDDIRSDPDLT